MYLPLMYCIKAIVCRLYEMLYPCSCKVVISCWKSGAYGIVICRGGTDICFVPESGWKHLDLEQYCISGLTKFLFTEEKLLFQTFKQFITSSITSRNSSA